MHLKELTSNKIIAGLVIATTGAVLSKLGLPFPVIIVFSTLGGFFFFENKFTFATYIIASNILFFPADNYLLKSTFIFECIHIVDPLIPLWILSKLIRGAKTPSLADIFRPNVAWILFLIFAFWVLISTFNFSTSLGLRYGVFYSRKFVTALFIAFIMLSEKKRPVRFFWNILLVFLGVSLLGGLTNSGQYYYRYLILGQDRLQSRWLAQISFYLSLSVAIGVAILPLFKNQKLRAFSIVVIISGTISAVVDQTRGFWIGAMLALFCYIVLFARRHLITVFEHLKNPRVILLFSLLCVSFAIFILPTATSRFSDVKPMEIVDPLSSVGYRIYEAGRTYKEATFFGHGNRAPLFLFLPWEGRITGYYGIHSLYAQTLHCFGVFGLTVLIILILFVLFQSIILIRKKRKLISFFGSIVLIWAIYTFESSILTDFFMRTTTAPFVGFCLAILVLFDKSVVKKIECYSDESITKL